MRIKNLICIVSNNINIKTNTQNIKQSYNEYNNTQNIILFENKYINKYILMQNIKKYVNYEKQNKNFCKINIPNYFHIYHKHMLCDTLYKSYIKTNNIMNY